MESNPTSSDSSSEHALIEKAENVQHTEQPSEQPQVSNSSKKQRLPHIKVFLKEHEKIMKNVQLLREKFLDKAKYQGIDISNKGKGRDVIPSQPEAMEYFFGHWGSMDDYVNTLIKRAKAAQGVA